VSRHGFGTVVHRCSLTPILFWLALAATAGCQPRLVETGDPLAEIRALLTHSAAAWNAGDLDGFVSDYAVDSLTAFVADGRPQYGYDWIRNHYAPTFAVGAQRDSLRFDDIAARLLGTAHALATARFVLFRGDSVTASGPFTLVLTRTDGRWLIIHDHTSSDPQ
jgi:uncharacterized protein (TIGR02246 family)